MRILVVRCMSQVMNHDLTFHDICQAMLDLAHAALQPTKDWFTMGISYFKRSKICHHLVQVIFTKSCPRNIKSLGRPDPD